VSSSSRPSLLSRSRMLAARTWQHAMVTAM